MECLFRIIEWENETLFWAFVYIGINEWGTKMKTFYFYFSLTPNKEMFVVPMLKTGFDLCTCLMLKVLLLALKYHNNKHFIFSC